MENVKDETLGHLVGNGTQWVLTSYELFILDYSDLLDLVSLVVS